jgi:hypothetical protein
VARGGIPQPVRALIADHVHSISQLDLLLFLHGAGGRALTAADVSRELRIPERLAEGQLLDFTAAGLVVADTAAPPSFRLDRESRHAPVVAELGRCVAERRRAVHDLILTGPSDDVQVFSDAFRLRREDDD